MKVRNDFSATSTLLLILFYFAALDAALAARKVRRTTTEATTTVKNKINFFLPANFLFEPPDLSILINKTKTEADRLNLSEKVEACQEEIDKGVILTENNARTYCTSDNPVVDFFFHVMEQTEPEDTIDLLEKSWAYSPDDTLRLIVNLRDIRRGKNIRYQSMFCFYWLYKNHPLTLYNNLEYIIKVGYWKDLLHIMMTILFDGHVGEHLQFDDCPDIAYYHNRPSKRKVQCYQRGRVYSDKVVEYFDEQFDESINSQEDLDWKYGKRKFERDPKYRLFHLKIAQLFANQLKKDLKYLEANKTHRIGLCAKWSPSDTKHFDRFSLIKTSIAAKLLDENNPILKTYKNLTDGLEDQSSLQECQSAFAYFARRECDKKYIKPLRQACKVPELYMEPGKWGELDYKFVASKCMMKNKKSFIKHDQERFESFIKKSKKVAGATLKPVELVQKILEERSSLCKEIYEKQWISIVESLSGKGGLFESALSICDVSGSMSGVPLNAALGLTLLTSQLSKFPWSSICMTFSSKPQFHKIDQKTLLGKLRTMQRMKWEMNTNVDAAFKLILRTAIRHKLKSEDLPKILFLFTDMEFDQCVQSNKTNFEYIKKRFVKKGYKLPTVVFWNLRSSGRHSTPVESTETGFILISGYSPKLLSQIMKCKNISEINPIALLKQTLKMYKNLTVFD